jgi:hypothetical protein
VKHVDLRPGLESDARAIRKGLVDFDGDDAATWAGKFGENGRVIACATTEMKNVVARMDVEQVQMNSPKAGLTVVEALGRIENNERILIYVARFGAFSEGLFAAGLDHPWAGTGEAFTGNRRECGKNSGRRDAITSAKFLGERAASGFDRNGFEGLHRVGRH